MATRVDSEEIQLTRSEKVLAAVLVVFLLVGASWFYVKIDVWGHDLRPDPRHTSAERAVLFAPDTMYDRTGSADEALADARTRLEVATAAERPKAQAAYDAARKAARLAHKTSDDADRAAVRVEKSYQDRVDRETRPRVIGVALARLVLVLGWVVGSYVLLGRLRRRASRALPLAHAAVGTGAILALVYLVDYLTDWINPLDLGVLVLSVLGSLATIAAFVVLQRHLARRLPGRRVRKGECPYCGFPVVGDGPHCEGCGRDVVAECSSCAAPRRVGSPHCRACGEA